VSSTAAMSLPIQIDPLSSDPISDQVVFQVKAAVARGEARVGDQLPSVRELARELSVNPNTVARCYQVLEADGVIVRRQGRGCFVKGAGGAGLSEIERGRRVELLLERAATEAFHLGASQDELRAALERALAAQARPERSEEA
jgi:GntR family transcriptional regulator